MTELYKTLNTFGNWLSDHLWSMSIELALFGVLVALSITLLRIKKPALRHLFWCLILIKPIATFLIASPVSLYGFLLPPEPAPLPIVTTTTAPPVRMEMPEPIMFEREFRTAPIAPSTPITTTAPTIVLDHYGVIGLVWIVIAGVFAIRLIVGFAYVSFLRHTATIQHDGPMVDLLHETARHMGLRHHGVLALSDITHGPVLAGITRPIILIPRHIAEAMTREQLKRIFAHELTHMQRRDNAVLLIQRIAEMLLFFHPVVWLCGWQMRREAEAACDDAVLRHFEGAELYADSLTRVAEMRDGLTRRLLVNTFAAAESNLARRIKRILHGAAGRMTFRFTIASIIMLIIIGCVGLPTAAKRKTKENTVGTTKDIAAEVRREGDKVWVEGIAIKQSIPHLNDGATDSQVLAIKPLLEHRGVQTDVNELLALSGDAFNLTFTRNWHNNYCHLALPTDGLTNIARAYGYDARYEVAGFIGKLKKDGVDTARPKTLAILKQLWAELDEGRPVLIGGVGGHCGNWAVVDGYDRVNMQLRYADTVDQSSRWGGINGINENTFGSDGDAPLGFWDAQGRGMINRDHPKVVGNWWASPAFILGKRASTPSERDRTIEALKRAIAMFTAPEFHNGDWATAVFGGQAYKEWADALLALNYPDDVLDAENPNRYKRVVRDRMVVQIVRGRTAAADFCEKATDALPKGADHLRRAAKLYREQIAKAQQAFAPFNSIAIQADAARNAWLQDKSKREAGFTAIHEMWNTERAAVNAIREALAAEGITISAQPAPISIKVSVERDGKKVWIEGARDIFNAHVRQKDAGQTVPWAERSDTYMYLAQLRVAGYGVDYATLHALAGYSGSFAYAPKPKDDWGRHYWPVAGRDERIANATGCRVKWQQYKNVEDYWQALKQAIDEGRAVQGPKEEGVLFIGYVDADRPEDRKVMPLALVFVKDEYWTWQQFSEWHSRFGQWLGHIVEQAEPGDPRESAIETIQTMVKCASGNDPRKKGDRPVTFGIAGVEAYARDLADMNNSGAREDKGGYWQDGWMGCHNVYPQISGRPAAAKYLRSVAEHFDGDTRKHIEAAAAHYDRATESWTTYLTQLGGHTGRTVPVEHEVAWTTAQYRKAGADAVAQAAKHERSALGSLMQALAAADVDVPSAGGAKAPEPTRKMIEGIKRHRLVLDSTQPAAMNHPAGLLLSAKHLNLDHSPAWVYGATGFAFAINMPTVKVCPSGPTAWRHEQTDSLATNIGLDITRFFAQRKQDGFKQKQEEMFELTRQAIDANQLVIGWEMVHPDWYPVVGYDDQGHYLFIDHEEKLKSVHHGRIGEMDLPIAMTLAAKPCKQADDRKTVRDVLHFALACAGNGAGLSDGRTEWVSGLPAYQVWIALLESDNPEPDGLGQHYNAMCWAECRAYTVPFLEEAKKRLSDAKLNPTFDRAIKHYQRVANHMMKLYELSPFDWSDHQAATRRFKDPATRAKWVEQLRAAHEAERAGLQALAEIAKSLGDNEADNLLATALAAKAIPVAVSPSSTAARKNGKVILENVKRNPAWMAQIGCIYDFVQHQKLDIARAWLYGGSGYAFALNIHDQLCPSGPTAWKNGGVDRLCENVGVKPNALHAWKNNKDFADRQREAFERVKAAIDAGRPCTGWELDVPEWYTIVGYDDQGNYLFNDFDGSIKSKKHDTLAVTGIGWLGMICPTAVKPTDDRTIVREALRFALNNAAGKHKGNGYHAGLAGYEAWIAAIGVAYEDDHDGFGHGYNTHAWAECRGFAPSFLQMAKDRLDDEKLDPLFDRAIEHYRVVAKELEAMAQAFPFDPEKGAEMRERFQKGSVRNAAIENLTTARDAEREGLKALAAIATALGDTEADALMSKALSNTIAKPAGLTKLDGLEFPKWSISYLGCLSACADYLKHDVSRPWLYGGTAHAFFISIKHNVDLETVTAWDNRSLATLAKNLGLKLEGIGKWNDGSPEFKAQQAKAWNFVREGIRNNQPCFGWELKAPFGDFWLITGFDDVGYHYQGWQTGGPTPWQKLGAQFIPNLEVYRVSTGLRADDATTVRDALVTAIKQAQVDWDAGHVKHGYRFGPTAFDAWAHALETGVAKRNHHAYNAKSWHECREMAVKFLVEAKGKLPGKADAAFDQAITQYTVVRDKLAAAIKLTPIDNKLGWGDEPKLKHTDAAKLIREAGQAEREGLKALAEIAKALGSKKTDTLLTKVLSATFTPPTEGTHTVATASPIVYDKRVVLENVPRPWASCSSLAVLAASLKHRGENISYTYLMGTSSRAFRFQFSWCPSAPHAYIGFNCWKPALKAVGYESQSLAGTHVMTQKPAAEATPEQQEQTRIAVKTAIDAGQTVIFGSEEDALLIGYEPPSEANPTGWIARPGPLGGPPPKDEPYSQPVKKMPWGLCTLNKTSEPMSRRDAAMWAIETAVLNAERGFAPPDGPSIGFAAWQKWIDELSTDKFNVIIDHQMAVNKKQGREKKRGDTMWSYCLGNAWCYENLHFARYEAAKYLRDIANDMPEAMRPHLLKAADEYDQVKKALVPEKDDCFTKIAPYPWSMKDIQAEWTDALRDRQRQLLMNALPHERAAIDALKQAITAQEKKEA